VHIEAGVLDANGGFITGQLVTFQSSNVAIVTVSPIGDVTSVGPAGTAQVTVRAAGLTRAIPVTVVGIPTSIRFQPDPGVLRQKETLQLTTKLLDLTGGEVAGATFTFSSSQTSIATVSQTGLVTSVGPTGTAMITATSGAVTGSVSVAVTPVVTTLDVSPSVLRIATGGSALLRPTVRDAVGAVIQNAPVTYLSNNPALVTVSASGLVTSIAGLGTTTVQVRIEQLVKVVNVTVAATVHPQGVVEATVALPGSPFGVSVAPSGTFYVSRVSSPPVFGVLPATATTTLSSVMPGLASAMNSRGTVVYFATYGSNVVAVDVATNAVLWMRQVPGTVVFDVVVSPDDRFVFATSDQGHVVAIDVATQSIVWDVNQAGVGGIHLAVHPLKPLLYTSSGHEINVDTRAVRRVLQSSGQDLVVTSDGAQLFSANETQTVAVLDLNTGASSTVNISGCSVYGLLMTADAMQLYASCSIGGSVAVIDRATLTVEKLISVSGRVRRMASSADGSTILVANEAALVLIK
jgi:WD40 repeat protein